MVTRIYWAGIVTLIVLKGTCVFIDVEFHFLRNGF